MKLLTHETDRTQALPGVHEVVQRLAGRSDVVLGLLTGNWPETGRFKLRSAGLDPDVFPLSVWGDESPHDPPRRDHLPPVAMNRYRQRVGRDVNPAHVTIIGDTPMMCSVPRRMAAACWAWGRACLQRSNWLHRARITRWQRWVMWRVWWSG